MAKRRRRRRRRKQLVPVLVAMLLVVLVAIAGIITGFIKKYTPSDARMDLADYYHTSEDEAALILQDTISEWRSLFTIQHYNQRTGRTVLLG